MLNLNKKDTQVSKNGYDSSKFEFRILDESALKDVKGLQSEILDELGPEQTFITENTDEDFKGYLSGKKGKILGVYDKENGKLFGMVILKSSYVPDVSFDHIGDKNIYCIGGLLVHKDYRGHSIGSILISKMKEKYSFSTVYMFHSEFVLLLFLCTLSKRLVDYFVVSSMK